MKINEIAETLNITQNQLRHWEEVFSLKISRDKKNQRLYTDEDIRTFQAIKALRDSDNGLETISRKLNINPISGLDEITDDNINLMSSIPKAVETMIRDNQKYIMDVLDSKLNTIVDLSEKYSRASFEIGKLQAELSSSESKVKLISDTSNKDISGLQKQIEKITADKNNDLEKQKIEIKNLKAELQKEKTKPWWKKILG